MKIVNKSKHTIIANKVIVCDSILKKAKGLMFKKIANKEACLLKFNGQGNFFLHGFFCPQVLKLICIRNNQVVELHTLKPFTAVRVKEKVDAVIEVLNSGKTHKGDKIKIEE